MKRSLRLIIPLAILAVAMPGCRAGDEPTAPVQAELLSVPGGVSASRGGEHEDTLRALRRTSAISRLTASRVIGPLGGELVLPGSGGRAIFPPGAVLTPTLITMTARAGTDVVYNFQPHLTFSIPVVIQQELGGTNAIGDKKIMASLAGGYYDGDYERNVTDVEKKFVRCKEVLPGLVDPGGRKFSFLVFHFSGYLASSGRAGKDTADDQ